MKGTKNMENNPISKVSIYFDMDTHKLEDSLGKSWRNAYTDIRNFMESKDYEHVQGSVYHSKQEREYADVAMDIKDLSKKHEWFSECVRKISFARISDEHDLVPVLEHGEMVIKYDFQKGYYDSAILKMLEANKQNSTKEQKSTTQNKTATKRHDRDFDMEL